MGNRRDVEGGFIIEQEHLPGRCYVLTGPWSARCAEVFRAEGAQFLRLNRTLGARFENLAFVTQLRGLRGIEIYDPQVTMKELAPVLELNGLELIGLQCKFRDIDFASRFPRLRLASFHWQRGCESVFRCPELLFLFTEGYPGCDLSAFAPLATLRRLHVNSKSLISADGIDELKGLEHLTFAYCSFLVNVEAVSRCTSLRVFELHNCKKVARLPAFSAQNELRRIQIENGAIESIKPLTMCGDLEEVYLPGTKIADGDISPLLVLRHLKRVAFPRNKAYSHSMDQINAELARRT
jgi:hypothetical protein